MKYAVGTVLYFPGKAIIQVIRILETKKEEHSIESFVFFEQYDPHISMGKANKKRNKQ